MSDYAIRSSELSTPTPFLLLLMRLLTTTPPSRMSASTPGTPNDNNIYTLGRVGGHNVVIACLPAGKTGTNSAAAVAVEMNSVFPSIRFGLMVGIGGAS